MLFDHYNIVDKILTDICLLEKKTHPAPISVEWQPSPLQPIGTLVPLPAPYSEGQTLETLLRSRTAQRSYSPAALTMDQVSSVLYAADAGDRLLWPTEQQANVSLELLVFAQRVNGLPAAVYHFHPDARSLVPVADLDSIDLEGLLPQREFVFAPMVLIITGNLAASVHRFGLHGYRLLVCRTGAAGHHAWMAALDVGLVGTVFASPIQGALRGVVPTDGYTRVPMFALSVGCPPM